MGATRMLVSLATAALASAVTVAADDADRYVFIKAGKVITVSGDEIDKGDIVIEDGKISLVGLALDPPAGARIIDARDQVVMPGLVVARTRTGLPSYSRRGTHGDRVAADEVYYDEIDFETLLEHGVTAVGFYPNGDGVPGVASAYRTGGVEDERLLRRSAYVRATLASLSRDKKTLAGAFDKAQSELDKVEKAREEWDKKQAERKKKEAAEKKSKNGDKPKDKPETPKDGDKPKGKAAPNPPDPDKPEESPKPNGEGKDAQSEPEKFEPPEIDKTIKPLADMIAGKGPRLLIELGGAAALLHAEDALKEHEKVKPHYYIAGSANSDINHVVERLGESNARVLTTPDLSELEYTSTAYNLPGELAAAGAIVGLTPWNTTEGQLRQYLPDVAHLVRWGFRRDDALKALTLRPAQLLGVSDVVGSIEPERSADLIFLSGDPLDPLSRVESVMLEGVVIWEREDD